jgi:CDGSH-type Zn-finger protein
MNKSNSLQKSPYKVELEEGQKYAFCTCGLSEKQPYCNGAHREDATFKPNVFVAEKSGTAFLCGCKMTGNPPYCDGTHNTI